MIFSKDRIELISSRKWFQLSRTSLKWKMAHVFQCWQLNANGAIRWTKASNITYYASQCQAIARYLWRVNEWIANSQKHVRREMHFQCHMPRIESSHIHTLTALLNSGQTGNAHLTYSILLWILNENNFVFRFFFQKISSFADRVHGCVILWTDFVICFLSPRNSENISRRRSLHSFNAKKRRKPAALPLALEQVVFGPKCISELMTDHWMDSSAKGECDRRFPAHTPGASIGINQKACARAYTFQLTKYDNMQ